MGDSVDGYIVGPGGGLDWTAPVDSARATPVLSKQGGRCRQHAGRVMIAGDDHARVRAQRAQVQSRVANIRLHTTSMVAASRRCVESSELLLAVERRRAVQW